MQITLEFSVTRIAPTLGSAGHDVYGLWRRKILTERLLQFRRIRVTQLEQIADDVIAIRNLGFIRK